MPKAIDSQVSLWPQRADHPTGWEDLVASMIRSTPRLDGAACYRNPRPFDGGNDPAPALALCRSCPALLACRRQIRR